MIRDSAHAHAHVNYFYCANITNASACMYASMHLFINVFFRHMNTHFWYICMHVCMQSTGEEHENINVLPQSK